MTSPTNGSLTRDALLAYLQPVVEELITIEGVGTLYVRSQPETLRARRGADSFADDGKPTEDFQQLRRVWTILDQVCDQEGQPIFKGKEDVEALSKVAGERFDQLANAVGGWNAKRAGENEGDQGGSDD